MKTFFFSFFFHLNSHEDRTPLRPAVEEAVELSSPGKAMQIQSIQRPSILLCTGPGGRESKYIRVTSSISSASAASFTALATRGCEEEAHVKQRMTGHEFTSEMTSIDSQQKRVLKTPKKRQ